MSKNYWHGYIKGALKRYPRQLETDGSKQALIALESIRAAIEKTQSMNFGDERMRLVKMCYISCTHTLNGGAYALHISRRTAQYWAQDFFNIVASEMGMTQ